MPQGGGECKGGLCGLFKGGNGEFGVSRTQFVEELVACFLALSALHRLFGYFLRDFGKIFAEIPGLQGVCFCF